MVRDAGLNRTCFFFIVEHHRLGKVTFDNGVRVRVVRAAGLCGGGGSGGEPTDLQWRDVAYVLMGSLVLSLIAAVYPAHRASKISPVLALDGLEAA